MTTMRYIAASWREILVGTAIGLASVGAFFVARCDHTVQEVFAQADDSPPASADLFTAFMGVHDAAPR